MKTQNKLPSVSDCIKAAEEIASEFKPKIVYERTELEEEYLFLRSQLVEFIKYCQNGITEKSKTIHAPVEMG